MKGKFITLYGINNIGKSTHAKLLVERLNAEGKKAKYIKFPIYDLTPTGPFINSVLRNHEGQKISEDELQLWFILNRYQFQPELKRLLDEGNIVVAEDYVWTGVAWGMAKGLSEDWLVSANQYLIEEDLAILFEGNRDTSAMEENHVHEQNEELIKNCTEKFNSLAEKRGWKRLKVQSEIDKTANMLWDIGVDGAIW